MNQPRQQPRLKTIGTMGLAWRQCLRQVRNDRPRRSAGRLSAAAHAAAEGGSRHRRAAPFSKRLQRPRNLAGAQKQHAEALANFQQAERWNPATPHLMRNVGFAAFRANQYAEAARALKTAEQ